MILKILNVLHSSLKVKVFWRELLLFFSGMNLACVDLLTVCPFKEILNFMIYMKMMNSVCSKMKIKPTLPAHSFVPCDAMRSQQFQIFYSLNLCSNTWMNNWGLFYWLSYFLFLKSHYSFSSWGIAVSTYKTKKIYGS